MIKFMEICRFIRRHYPILWEHTSVRNRRIMVYYWFPHTGKDPLAKMFKNGLP